jgi:hypothetical protein
MSTLLAPNGRPAREELKRRGHRLILRPWQYDVFEHESRFRVKVCGRRSGKTFEDACELIRAAVNRREQVVWYVAPTYKMAKEIMWTQLKKLVPREYLRRRPLETDLLMEFVNGSIIQLKGGEDPDALRGPGLDYLSCDEFAYLDARAWYEVLSPMLADRLGRATFSTTPAGLNWAYDLFNEQYKDDEWKSFTVTTLASGGVPAKEIEKQKARMTARVFRQEFEASFEAVGNRVYDSFEKANFRDDVQDIPSQELLVGMDFNVNPMSLTLGVAVGKTQLHVFDALEVDTSNTHEVAKELRARFPERTIVVCPDPSGKARKTSANNATDFTILQEQGFVIDAPNSAPEVRDRINTVNALACNALGERNLFIHTRCMPTLGRALTGLTYKPGTSIPEKNSLVHITDALGYLVWQRFNFLAPHWRSVKIRYA